jgi:hypothetical protein
VRSDLTGRAKGAIAFLVAMLPASCLLDWDSLRPMGTGVDASDDVGSGDVTTDEGAATDASDAGDATSCVVQLEVNEVQTDGPLGPSDEFVELRNGAPCGGSLLDWTLSYSSASGSSPFTLWTGQAGDTVGPAGSGGYVLLGGYIFQTPDGGVITGRISTDVNGSLSENGGGVGLFSPSEALVDSVAYATLTTATHPFIRPLTAPDGGPSTPAPNPPSGKSIARIPDGFDTNTSATDFQVATPTPGFAN